MPPTCGSAFVITGASKASAGCARSGIPDMRGRLNVFQCAMLRWREHAPYNAVHAAELPGPLDRARLERAIAAQLEALGVTGLRLDARQRRYEYSGGPATVSLRVIAGGAAPSAVLDEEMGRHFNIAFPREGAFDPFRFFAVDAGATFYVGVAYDHFIAGGDSMVALLKGIAGRYDGTATDAAPPPDLYPASYAKLFLRNFGYFYVGQFSLPSMIARARRAVRPRYPYGDAPDNAFAHVRLDARECAALLRTAKAWGVTLNDLLLAALLSALAPEVGERNPAERRHEIAIASVINLRHKFVPDTARAFGQFLSSFLVSHRLPPGIRLETLAQDIHRQTRRLKQRKLYLQTLYLLALGGVAWRYMTAEQRKHMHAKNYPVWAGMTMLNINAIWRNTPGTTPVPAYVRSSSTGPFAPLVVAPASCGDAMIIGLTYRTSAFRREDVLRIGEALQRCARSLC
jgi:hypothetical protein